jgi:FAD/FMN-containing dehydrogenase
MHYYWKTEYAAELGDELLASLRERFAACTIPGADLGILHLDGALGERAWDDGAVGNRDVRYVIGIKGMWEPGEPDGEGCQAWIRDAWQAIRPFTLGRTYINFQTGDEGEDRVRAAYGANYERLVAAKARFDPGNLFRSNRNIRPAAQTVGAPAG